MTATAERLTAAEIYENVERSAQDEISRGSSALALSGLAAGIAMGLSGLGVAAGLAILGPGSRPRFVASMLYPVGFIAVIVGRSQLFTVRGATANGALRAVVHRNTIVAAQSGDGASTEGEEVLRDASAEPRRRPVRSPFSSLAS